MTSIQHTSQAEERRAAIKTAAARLFDERGVDRVSMDEVAKAVGLAKPTLYHYFKSKEEILFAIHTDLFELILGKLEARLAGDGSVEDQLFGVFCDIFEGMDSHPGHTRVAFEHMRLLPDEYKVAIREAQRKYERMVEQILVRGVKEGVLRDVDTRLASLAIFGMTNWSYQWYRPSGRYTVRELAESFFGMLMIGLAAETK